MNTSSGRKSLWVVMGFATPIFLLSAIRLGIAPLLPQIKQSFSIEYGTLSLIPTAFFLSTVLLAAPLGHLTTQVGLKRCTLSIVSLVILSSLLCATSGRLWLLIVFLFVMGMALSAAFPLARTAVDVVYAPGAAGRAMMLIGFPGMLGSMLGGILFGRLAEQMGWRNSFGVQGTENTQTQYYQAYHHKRLLSGNISRNPPFKFDYFSQVPILDSLITLQTYGQVEAQRRATDKATADEFVRFYDIRYVVVTPGIPGRPPYVDTRDEAVAYVEEVLPVEKVYDQDGWLLYRVNRPAIPSPFEVDFGSAVPRTLMALGEGWAADEEIQGASANWAAAQQAQVFLPAAAGQEYDLSVTAMPFDYPEAEQQAVTLWVNGQRLEQLAMPAGWTSYDWTVPAHLLRPGLNDVRFEFDHLAAPAEVLPGNGAIGATGVQAPVAIEVNSGGPADFAYITVGTGDEAQDGSVHRPGYNVAVLHPQSGKLLDQRGFDTTSGGSEAEAAALADFLSALPKGRIVVVALQGDGAAHLTDEAVAALRQIGAEVDVRGTAGWSHALVGVKGAQPGTALEVAGPENGWLRVAPDRRTLAIAVDTLLWEGTGGPDPKE